MNRPKARPRLVPPTRPPVKPPRPAMHRPSQRGSTMDPALHAALVLLAPLVILRVVFSVWVGSYNFPWYLPFLVFTLFYLWSGYLAANFYFHRNRAANALENRGRKPSREKGVAAAMTLCLLSWTGFVLGSLLLDVLMAGGYVVWDAPTLACIGPIDFLAAMSLGAIGSSWAR